MQKYYAQSPQQNTQPTLHFINLYVQRTVSGSHTQTHTRMHTHSVALKRLTLNDVNTR